jgi:hypothetical protein
VDGFRDGVEVSLPKRARRTLVRDRIGMAGLRRTDDQDNLRYTFEKRGVPFN